MVREVCGRNIKELKIPQTPNSRSQIHTRESFINGLTRRNKMEIWRKTVTGYDSMLPKYRFKLQGCWGSGATWGLLLE